MLNSPNFSFSFPWEQNRERAQARNSGNQGKNKDDGFTTKQSKNPAEKPTLGSGSSEVGNKSNKKI